MSNFYYEPTSSQGAQTVLDEQIATETRAPDTAAREIKTHEAPAVRIQQQNYALFHYVLLFYLYLYCTRIPELKSVWPWP